MKHKFKKEKRENSKLILDWSTDSYALKHEKEQSTEKKNRKKMEKNGITYRENKIVATFENLQKEESPSPHHLDEILRHVYFLTFKINPICLFIAINV